jgi:hypothetical protein
MTTLTTETFGSAPAWTAIDSTFTVSGGTLRPSAINTDTSSYSNTDMGSSDHWAQCDLITSASTNNVYCGLILRGDGTSVALSAGPGYVFSQNFKDFEVYGAKAGPLYEPLALIVDAFATPGTYTIYAGIQGSALTVKLNGSAIAGSPFTTTWVASGTKVHCTMYEGGAVTDTQIDNFSAGDFVSNVPIHVLGRYTPGTVQHANLTRR